MGLDIYRYSYSYSKLHVLRAWAHEVVGKAPYKYMCTGRHSNILACNNCLVCKWSAGKKPKIKFVEFINHSDCEGTYEPGVKRRNSFRGKLDVLKKEVKELNKHKHTLDESYRQCWDDFYHDVMQEDRCLRFH